MKKPVSLLLTLLMCLTLCACGEDSGIKESQILSDIPEQFITVDGQLLSYDSIDVSKRNTKEDVDSIYFSLTASNDNYEVTAQCHFKYNYYSEGGWILDYAEIVNGKYTVIPLNERSRDDDEEYMQDNYMDYWFISSDFGADGDQYYTEYTYEGENEWTYYSQRISNSYRYTFETELEVREDSEDIYCNDIFTDWRYTDGDYEIIYDHWNLSFDFVVEDPYSSSAAMWLHTVPDPEAEPDGGLQYTYYLLYDGIYYDSDFLFSELEYNGSGETKCEINYDKLYDPYAYFEVTLYYVQEDGSLSYNTTHKLGVKVKKDCVYMNNGFASNWFEVEVE